MGRWVQEETAVNSVWAHPSLASSGSAGRPSWQALRVMLRFYHLERGHLRNRAVQRLRTGTPSELRHLYQRTVCGDLWG